MSDYAPTKTPGALGARIAVVEPYSVAAAAGLKAGMSVQTLDGEPLRDYIDWLWRSDGRVIELRCVDAAGREKRARLEREPGQPWGIHFDEAVFDAVRTCTNVCVFCFMAMLPPGLRPSLYLRDDDYRLSFLQGNFVTLTNMEDADVRRVVDCRLSPLHVSLHAVTPAVRRRLIGPRHAQGMQVLEQLLAAGIEAHAQVVLMPGVNDGGELEATLAWAGAHPGIRSVGVVPYGYTRHARVQGSYQDAGEAQKVLDIIAHKNKEGRKPGGPMRFQASDELYLQAYGDKVLGFLPLDEEYGSYPQLEDGIGMLRLFVDGWHAALATCATAAESASASCASRQPEPSPVSMPTYLIATGTAFAPVLGALVGQSPFADRVEVRGVENRFFGGNVDVAGLTTAHDLIEQLGQAAPSSRHQLGRAAPSSRHRAQRLVICDAMLNDDGLFLDDMTAADLSREVGMPVDVLSCSSEALVKLLSQEVGIL
ncbi:MAG: DUF512 domain-containing protein [Coriobacteriales bacterium]|jgi:putative radical SAM enzyme (TIGR03279 family)|nr:DUF512 domain-containing protein [Coriobacteriales bacterium]